MLKGLTELFELVRYTVHRGVLSWKICKKKSSCFMDIKDNRSPLMFGRCYKEHLLKAELIEFLDASNFTIQRYDEEILRGFIGPVLPTGGLHRRCEHMTRGLYQSHETALAVLYKNRMEY